MSSEDWLLKFSSRDLTKASASSGVKNSLPTIFAGRSSGVYVALVQLPVRSGAPSGVRGAVHAFAGLAAAFPDDCAITGSDPRDATASAASTTRMSYLQLDAIIPPYFFGSPITSTVLTANRRQFPQVASPSHV